MSIETAVEPRIAGARVDRGRAGPTGLRPLDLFILSAWLGLSGGLLEVLARVVGKRLFSHNHLYMMTRHFFWLGPLSNLLFFTSLGLLLVLSAPIWPRFVRWLGPRLIGFLAIVPILIVLAPQIYGWAWAVFALGAALRLAPVLERHAATLRRRLLVTFPILV